MELTANQLLQQGITALSEGNFEEAEASYKKALELKPDFTEAHYNLGVTLKGLGKLDEAIASYKKAIKSKPNYAKAHYNLGNILKELNKLEELSQKLSNKDGNSKVEIELNNQDNKLIFKLKNKRQTDRKSINLLKNKDISVIIN